MLPLLTATRFLKVMGSSPQKLIAKMALECAPMTTAITRYEREIALLREYRTRLTADVVTGKLDVRAAAAQLPETKPAPAEVPVEPFEAESELEELEG